MIPSTTFRLGEFLEVAHLPLGVYWYDVEGTVCFPLFNKEGNLLTDRGAWLIRNIPPDAPMAAGIRFSLAEMPKLSRLRLADKIAEAMTRLELFDPNGGPLPKIPEFVKET